MQAVRGQVLATAARTVECRLKRGPRRLPGSDRAVRLRIVGYRASSSRQDQVPRKLRATSKNPLAPGSKNDQIETIGNSGTGPLDARPAATRAAAQDLPGFRLVPWRP